MITRIGLVVFMATVGLSLPKPLKADDDGVAVLIEQLKHPNDDRRKQAANALGNLGPKAKAAVPPLIKILRNKEELYAVRNRASYALGKIGPDAKAAIPVFLQMIHAKEDS